MAHRANQAPQFETRCFYGQLELILSCTLKAPPVPGHDSLHKLFGVVRTCITNGADATIEPVTYTALSSSLMVIELTTISCAIGRVKIGTGHRWGIVDRSTNWVRPVFVEEDHE